MSETTSRPDAAIAAARAADQELLDRVERWSQAGGDPAAPSVLDGWTIGHVVSHLARNADGFRNVARGTAVGEQWPMYESVESRQADIDAGAGRSAEELSADLRQSVDRLYAALAEADWAGSGLTVRGPIAMTEIPERRRREVIQVFDHGELVRQRAVEACPAHGAGTAHRVGQPLGRHFAVDVAPFHAVVAVGGLDHGHRRVLGGGLCEGAGERVQEVHGVVRVWSRMKTKKPVWGKTGF